MVWAETSVHDEKTPSVEKVKICSAPLTRTGKESLICTHQLVLHGNVMGTDNPSFSMNHSVCR